MSRPRSLFRAVTATVLLGFAATGEVDATDPLAPLTSYDLLRQHPETWRQLDDATRDRLLPNQRKGMARASIIDSLEDEDTTWFVHEGHLTLPATLDNGDALIVLGNLVIDGSYNDDTDRGYGQLIVLGDLQVEHVVSWGSLHVDRDLRATGVVHAYYNDFTFEVVGTLTARLFVVDDKSSRWGALQAEAFLDLREGSTEEAVTLTIQMLHPAMIEFGLLDEGAYDELWPSYEQLQKRVAAGTPVFRNRPAGPELIEHIALLLDPNTTRQQAEAILFEDLLLTHLAAYWREDLTRETLEAMIATGDPLVLRALAFENRSIPARLRKRAQKALEARP